ncbi:MAG: molybdenum ABC transporter ATP-binding protein [Burkholderiaceae bacterium]|jgi:molybdate transport system ATP-binding protein|nr:molybdenum ABC transporter ATP-binding protein [Burkholderiaceae bacterium]
MSSSIQARVHVTFSDYTLRTDLSLPGEGVTGIFGASGAGKSTLLRAIAGLERPQNSRIAVGDEVWHDDAQGIFVPPHKRALGFVFQEATLFSHLSVTKNLHFGLKRIPPAQRRISLDYVMDLLGIAHLGERSPDTLSGGEKQRVGIARALATSPRILLMDEPLASLDVKRKREILPYLAGLSEQLHIPILYVSHALDEMVSLADTLVLLDRGTVRGVGETRFLLTRLDLPLAHGRDAAGVVHGRVTEHDASFHLNTVSFDGGHFFLPGGADQVGKPIRLRVLASDVSLATEGATHTSVRNTLACVVADMHDDGAGMVTVELTANRTRLLSRITRKSAIALGLVAGKPILAQVKSVALVD